MMVPKTIQRPKPSKTLQRKIDACVSGFKKLRAAIHEALEQGREEGFEDKEIGKMIREKMLQAGFTKQTVSGYLPDSAKNAPRGDPYAGSKATAAIRQKKCLTNGVTKQQEQAEDFSILDLTKKAISGVNIEPVKRKGDFERMAEEEEAENRVKEQQEQQRSTTRMNDSEIFECDDWPVGSFIVADIDHYTLTYIKRVYKHIAGVIKELEQKEKLK